MSDETKYCEKIEFGQINNPTIILGIIVKEDDNFITVKTARHQHIIAKRSIISRVQTNDVFDGNYANTGGK